MAKLRKLRRRRLERRRGEERRELLLADPEGSLADAEAVVGEPPGGAERVDLRWRQVEALSNLLDREHPRPQLQVRFAGR
jgi:hypothetical protein